MSRYHDGAQGIRDNLGGLRPCDTRVDGETLGNRNVVGRAQGMANKERQKMATMMRRRNTEVLKEYDDALADIPDDVSDVGTCSKAHDRVLRADRKINGQVLENQAEVYEENGGKDKITLPVFGEVERRDASRLLVGFMVLWVFLKHVGVDPMELIRAVRGIQNETPTEHVAVVPGTE